MQLDKICIQTYTDIWIFKLEPLNGWMLAQL